MPITYSDGKAIFFAHVPKAGGSAIEDYLLRRFGNLSLFQMNEKFMTSGKGMITPAQHLTAVDLEYLLPKDIYYSFTMVRDPVSRLKSEYTFQVGSSRSSRLDFSTWLYLMLACLRIEPRVYDNHIRPQSDLVPENAEVFYLEQGGMQKMAQRFDEILGKSSPSIMLAKINESKKIDNIKMYCEDISAIEAAYSVDYDRFRFARRATSDLESDKLNVARRAFARILAPMIVARQKWGWVR